MATTLPPTAAGPGRTKTLSGFALQKDRVDRPEVAALIARHHKLMRDTSPPESCHVMDASELGEAGATLFSLSDGAQVVGIGAIKQIAPDHGEIKSMHVAAEARGKGASKALLTALIEAAKEAGFERVSLETGVEDVFEPARGLYLSFGFEPCPPFADYTHDPLSVFMTRQI